VLTDAGQLAERLVLRFWREFPRYLYTGSVLSDEVHVLQLPYGSGVGGAV